MKLENTVVTITVTISKIEHAPLGTFEDLRTVVKRHGRLQAIQNCVADKDFEVRIIDCPSYPALNE